MTPVYSSNDSRRRFEAGLTLIEMIVAIGLLVIVILGVGLIFQSASGAVGTSQRMLDMLSNVRSIQDQIDRDVAGMDKNCFLVIRSQLYQGINDVSGTPSTRCDLVSFVSYGSFKHRTGAMATNPFTDSDASSDYAYITWGQLAIAKKGGPGGAPTSASTYLNADAQDIPVPINQVPTGIRSTPSGLNDGEMTLGRNAILLFPPTGTSSVDVNNGRLIGAFLDTNPTPPVVPLSAIDWNTAIVWGSTMSGQSSDLIRAHITQSRVDAAATTPARIMNIIMQSVGSSRTAATARFEADRYCYRHATVRSAYDGTGNVKFVNAAFRMHPIALPGVTSFAIDWTDGTQYAGNETDTITGATVDPSLVGTTRWFGLGWPKNGSGDHVVDLGSSGTTAIPVPPEQDNYVAIFSYDTAKSAWPKALRFRYHVADPTNRLPGGRDFVQVVKLPN